MRLLAQNSLRYRRQILALKQFFIGRECTVLLLDDRTSEGSDLQLQSIAHGVITLEQLAPVYGAARRRLRVMKFRGTDFRGGYHDFTHPSAAESSVSRGWWRPSIASRFPASASRAASRRWIICWGADRIAEPARC